MHRVENNKRGKKRHIKYAAHTQSAEIFPIIGGGKFGGQAEREAGARAIYPISSGADGARGLVVAARQCDGRVRALELILFRRCSTVYQRISQKMSVSATVIRDNTRQIGNSAARYPRYRFCPVCSPISFITRQYLKKRKKEKELNV